MDSVHSWFSTTAFIKVSLRRERVRAVGNKKSSSDVSPIASSRSATHTWSTATQDFQTFRSSSPSRSRSS